MARYVPLLLITLHFISGRANAQQESWIDSYKVAEDAARKEVAEKVDEQLEKMTDKLGKLKRATINSHASPGGSLSNLKTYSFKTFAGRKKAIAEQQDKVDSQEKLLKDIKQGKTPVHIATLNPPLKVGGFGASNNQRCSIDQILDKHSALVDYCGTSLWLHDVDTTDFVDRQRFKADYIWIDGTHSYTSVSGAKRTVFSARIVSQKDVDDLRAKAAKGN